MPQHGPPVITAIVGPYAVGKTSLIQAFAMPGIGASRFTSPTIGAAVANHLFPLPESAASVGGSGSGMGCHTIWDTAGQERYASLVPMYTRNCDILIVAVPATEDPDPETVRRLLVAALPPIRSPKVIKGVLTKCDLVTPATALKRRLLLEEIITESPQSLNRQFEIHTYQTSAYNGDGVEECLGACVEAVYLFKLDKQESKREQEEAMVRVSEGERAPTRGRCTGGC